MTIVFNVIRTILIIYVLLVLLLYYKQDELLFQGPLSSDVIQTNKIDNAFRYIIQVEDAILNGWHVIPESESKGIVIYFGGNAENIDSVIDMSKHLKDVDIVSMHYRSYGLSTGNISESAIYKDALSIYDNVSKEYPNKPIYVIGRSLGSGVATYLAAHRNVSGVGLVTPYDSIKNVAQGHYPFFPVKYILNNKFDSVSNVKNINVPVYVLVASNDTLIPNQYSIKLFENIHSEKHWHLFDNFDHNNISLHKDYFSVLNKLFVKQE